MTEKRRYELKKRAESQAETRRRIVEATVELHRTVGPAATQISEVARRAGVQRVTVYNHFPDDASLFGACSEHWRSLHPAPDPATWTGDAPTRLRTGLQAIYGFYRETEEMTANVLRDAPLLPALGAVIDNGLRRYLGAVEATLAEPYSARGKVPPRVAAAVRAAVDFHCWRALSPLGDDEAAELGAGLVELAARS
jgi:AcrR family transcriptional regulator